MRAFKHVMKRKVEVMLKVINPATLEVIRELEGDTAETVSQKFSKAQAGQKDWAKTTIASRIAIIQKFKSLVERDLEKLALTTTQEVGKPLSQSRNELKGMMARIDFFLAETEKTLAKEVVLNDEAQKMREVIEHEPLGVIGNISAWNYPYFVGSNVFIPALLAGNAVLYKPSEFALMTGISIANLLHEAGIPEAVFIPILGDGKVGIEILKQNLAGIYFTGSYATGQKIAEAASKKLMRVQLELGGKDPVYVTEAVDVKAVAAGIADGAFYNTGQSCCSVERIYVHEKVYDAFVQAFVEEVSTYVQGDPLEAKTYLGPLTRPQHLSFLEAQVTDAVAKGAKLLLGGKKLDRSGTFFQPTVLSHVNHSMDLMRDETFGPLIGIQKVANDAEAVALMNDTHYGLTAGVYVQDEARAKGILSQINSGSVYWNCCDRVSPRLPWSGRGHSGMGCTLSHYGIQAFTQLKAWHLRG